MSTQMAIKIEPEEPLRGRTMEFTYKSGARPLDGYTVKRGIGWGGFGEVYYAVSDGGKEVALKLVQRHLDVELRGVAHCLNIKHPNLLSVFDIRQNDQGESWVVMEYMAGDSLRSRLDHCRRGLPLDETIHWLAGIAAALDFLHQHGVVHRDMKPGNVFSELGLVKVGDYGLSKFISSSRRSAQTQSVGTVHYMAPEISTGNYGKSVDIYSMAVIAFEMLSGEVPFDGETAGEILMKSLTAEPSLEKVDAKYRPLFAKALHKDPAKRWESAGELYQAIRAVCLGTEEKPASAQPQAVKAAAPTPIALDVSLPPAPGTFKAKRRAASELLWSLFVAGILSAILPVLAVTADMILVQGQSHDLKHFVSLAVLTGLSSWGVLCFAKYWEAFRVETATRRLGMLFYGLAMGATALAINLWLSQELPASLIHPVVGAGFHETPHSDLMPALLTYVSLFGLAFAIPDWGKSACVARPSRFSIGRVVVPGSLGVVLTSVLSGPNPLWVGAILAMTAMIVQWSTKFEPPKRRYGYAPRG